jgi:hypothetical protein
MQMESRAGGPRGALTNAARQQHTEQDSPSVHCDFLKLPEQEMLFCGVAIGYGDRKHKANDFRSPRAELHEFCKFYGFD